MTTPPRFFTVERAPGFALKVACKKESNDSCQCLLIPIAYRLQCSATARLTSVNDNTSATSNACQPTRNRTSAPSGDKGNWLSSILIYNAQLELPGFRAVSSLQVSCMLDQSSNFDEGHLISPGPADLLGHFDVPERPYKHSLTPFADNGGNLEARSYPLSRTLRVVRQLFLSDHSGSGTTLNGHCPPTPRTCKRVLE